MIQQYELYQPATSMPIYLSKLCKKFSTNSPVSGPLLIGLEPLSIGGENRSLNLPRLTLDLNYGDTCPVPSSSAAA